MSQPSLKNVSQESSALNLLVAALFAAFVCLGHIHQGSLSIDGIRYAHIANHILKSGNWLSLWDEYTGQTYVNKPPLLFWLTALSIRTFGFSTFSARLPGAIFALAALLMLFKSVQQFYGSRTAIIALALFVANSVFFRAVADLSFEGLLLCGALSSLHTTLKAARGVELRFLDWLRFGFGLLLCSVSKPPYILIILFPAAMLLLKTKQTSQLMKHPPFWASMALPPLIGLSWYLLNDRAYLQGAFNNQIIWPFVLENGFFTNLAAWAKTLLVWYAPLSWLGAVSLYRRLRGRQGPPNSEEFLLLCWLFPALPMVFLTTCRAPYLLVSFLALVVITARYLATELLRDLSLPVLRKVVSLSALFGLLVVDVLGVQAHELHPLVAALKQAPALIQQQRGEQPLLLCLNGKRNPQSLNAAKRAQMLIELEFNKTLPVYDSDAVPINGPSFELNVLADERCRQALSAKRATLHVIREFERATLLKLIPAQP